MKVLGIVLILFGVFSLAYGGVTYTRQDKVLDAGPIEASVSSVARRMERSACCSRGCNAGSAATARDCIRASAARLE